MSDCIELDPQSGFFPTALGDIARIKKIPLKAQLELTARCNFNCKMCYIHMNEKRIEELGRELTIDEWLRIAGELKELGTLYLSLTGGEVFVRRDFRTLYEKLSKMGFLIQIMTNISLIDETTMDWLAENPPYCINTTIYGSNNDVYRAVTGVEHGFDRFDRALNLLLDAGIPVTVKGTLTRLNEDDVPNMYHYCKEHGLILQATYGVNKAVRGAVSEADKVRRMRYQPLDSSVREVYVKREDGHGPYRHHKNYLDDCGAYGNSLNVSWDGHAILCSFMAEPFIDLKTTSLKEAWPAFLEKINKIEKPEKCNGCKYEEYCTRCPGALAAESGSYNVATEEYCKTAKYLYLQYNGGSPNEKV